MSCMVSIVGITCAACIISAKPVLRRPLLPVSLNEGCRVDEDVINIEYHGVALELLGVLCDFSPLSSQ